MDDTEVVPPWRGAAGFWSDLGAAGEEGFEVGFGGFLGGGGDVEVLEAGFLEEGVEFAFFEAKPDVGVELAGFFESVRLEVEDEDLTAGLQNAVGFGDGFLWVLRVMQGLAEDGEIDGGVGQGDGLDVTEFVGEIGEAVFGGELGADLDHARGIVDTPDARGAAGEELGDEAFAGAEVGDGDRGREAEC